MTFIEEEYASVILPGRGAQFMKNKMIEYTDDDTFQAARKEPGLLVLDFWAPWCGPCRMMMPVLEAAAARYEGHARFAKINIEQLRLAAPEFGVRAVPTLVVLKNGQEVGRDIGHNGEDALLKFLREYLGEPPKTATH